MYLGFLLGPAGLTICERQKETSLSNSFADEIARVSDDGGMSGGSLSIVTL